jgi:hypothetical protein
LGKNKKFAQRRIGPNLVTQVINDHNIELQISLKRRQIHSAYRVKKFISPEKSKFLNIQMIKENSSEDKYNEIMMDKIKKDKFEELENKIGESHWQVKGHIIKQVVVYILKIEKRSCDITQQNNKRNRLIFNN